MICTKYVPWLYIPVKTTILSWLKYIVFLLFTSVICIVCFWDVIFLFALCSYSASCTTTTGGYYSGSIWGPPDVWGHPWPLSIWSHQRSRPAGTMHCSERFPSWCSLHALTLVCTGHVPASSTIFMGPGTECKCTAARPIWTYLNIPINIYQVKHIWQSNKIKFSAASIAKHKC